MGHQAVKKKRKKRENTAAVTSCTGNSCNFAMQGLFCEIASYFRRMQGGCLKNDK